MSHFLVSGMAELVARVASVLRENGSTTVEVPDIKDVPGACADAGAGAFDGYTQAGKSTLANAMAERLGCAHVDGDDHTDRHRGVTRQVTVDPQRGGRSARQQPALQEEVNRPGGEDEGPA